MPQKKHFFQMGEDFVLIENNEPLLTPKKNIFKLPWYEEMEYFSKFLLNSPKDPGFFMLMQASDFLQSSRIQFSLGEIQEKDPFFLWIKKLTFSNKSPHQKLPDFLLEQSSILNRIRHANSEHQKKLIRILLKNLDFYSLNFCLVCLYFEDSFFCTALWLCNEISFQEMLDLQVKIHFFDSDPCEKTTEKMTQNFKDRYRHCFELFRIHLKN